jgi:hypothetical protein
MTNYYSQFLSHSEMTSIANLHPQLLELSYLLMWEWHSLPWGQSNHFLFVALYLSHEVGSTAAAVAAGVSLNYL